MGNTIDRPDQEYNRLSIYFRGGQGQIHKWRRRSDGVIIAAKIFHGSGLGKLEPYVTKVIEKLMNNPQHPNIIRFLRPYSPAEKTMLTEYYLGGDLESLTRRYLTVDPVREMPWNVQMEEMFIWHVALQMADALSYLHSLDIVHGDIKPANIFLDRNPAGDDRYPIIKLGDLDMAEILSDSFECVYPTGTPGYLAPEYPICGKASDVWGIGTIIMRLALDRTPAVDISPELYYQDTQKSWRIEPKKYEIIITDLQHFSRDLNTIMMSTLEKDPAKRIKADDLAKWIRELKGLEVEQARIQRKLMFRYEQDPEPWEYEGQYPDDIGPSGW